MSVKVKMQAGWDKSILASYNAGLLEMVTDIHRRAVINAPIKDGALKNSGRIVKAVGGYAVRFGSARVPYARIQELGGTIRPKNAKVLAWKDGDDWRFAKSVTIKGKRYLTQAADSVVRGNLSKYWSGKI